jgi:hypothetical protein
MSEKITQQISKRFPKILIQFSDSLPLPGPTFERLDLLKRQKLGKRKKKNLWPRSEKREMKRYLDKAFSSS